MPEREHCGRDGELANMVLSPVQQAAELGRERRIDADFERLCAARRERRSPPPTEYAELIRRMAALELDVMNAKWERAGHHPRPTSPGQRSTWSTNMASTELQRLCSEDAA